MHLCAAGQGGLVDHGVHAFIVPLRDEAGRCLPGVEIHDCGYKVVKCGFQRALQNHACQYAAQCCAEKGHGAYGDVKCQLLELPIKLRIGGALGIIPVIF